MTGKKIGIMREDIAQTITPFVETSHPFSLIQDNV